jgi:soluble lytic murein transglycosylase
MTFIKKMPKKNKITSFIAFFFLYLFAITDSLIADSYKDTNISKKLWHEFSNSDKIYFKEIKKYIRGKKYDKALNLCHNFAKNSVIGDSQKLYSNFSNNIILAKKDYSDAICRYIQWQKYSNATDVDDIEFSEISKFIENNKFFHNTPEIKKVAEKIVIKKNLNYEEIIHYFALNPAILKETKIYLLQAKIDFLSSSNMSFEQMQDFSQDISDYASKIWIEENFSKKDELNFLDKYGKYISHDDYVSRIERLLINNMFSDANRIINEVDEDYQRLFSAIKKIRPNKRYINNYILTIPRYLRNNEILLYKRLLWHKSRNDFNQIVKILKDIPEDANYNDKWWSLRRLYARELLKRKDYKISYKIISNHGLSSNHKKYWEAQWTSGWISLRFLKDPRVAYDHFMSLYNNVKQPVSLSRAAYWIGMSLEAMNKNDRALIWYKKASNYPIYFYGQLAINKVAKLSNNSEEFNIKLPENPKIKPNDIINIANSRATQIAYILLKENNTSSAKELLKNIILNATSGGQISIIMNIVSEFSNKSLEVSLAREAAKRDVFFMENSFKILDRLKSDENSSMIHAIIRQESGFVRSALSSAGAVGYMQVMPDTARLVARDLGIRYSKRKLSRDIDYNIKIGSHYIKTLLDKFDGSELLAIAAYNAGPNNAYRWIEEFYDPRIVGQDIDKVVDWIELITYYETRNYVQRIMENIIIYKYLLSKNNA